MERMQFIKTDKKGNKVVCETIATYHDEDDNKDYIVYTDNTFDENNKLKVYYSLYEMLDKNIKLIEIKTNEERKIGLELVKSILEDLKIEK